MFPHKQSYVLYLLICISIVCTSALANTKVYELISETVSVINISSNKSTKEVPDSITSLKSEKRRTKKNTADAAATAMFTTIIEGADSTDGCTDNGFTVARFILCGDSDDRLISLSGGPYTTVSWEQLGGACTSDTNVLCPNTTNSCYTQVAATQTYNLDSSTISATDGAEFRVFADGMVYYFEVTKSTIDQSYLKTNFICNNPGRIELTGLPNSYIFRIREEGNLNFDPSYQDSSIFLNLSPGRYIIDTKLDIPGDVCVYTYPVIEIVEENIDINVTFTDALCAGQAGSIDVAVLPDNIGPYVFKLLDENGVTIEFTSTISSNTHTFSTVSPGTYSVKVETNECKEDIPNGISAPIQDLDTTGNPISIGDSLTPINVETDTNGEVFGCATINSVGIDISITGGSPPYSYTVDDGGNSGGTFTATDTYTVTSEGTYTFSITDAVGCTATKSEFVTTLDPPVVTVLGFDGTCVNGGARIEFTIVDSQGFNLEYRADSADPWSSSQTLPVSVGTYNSIEVRYFQAGFECTLTLPPVTVTSQVSITGAASKIQDYTCLVNGGGIINFNAGATNGGSGTGYEYSIDNITYQAGTSFTNLGAGTYTPYIRDDSGCAQALPAIDINAPEEPSAIDFVQDQLDCAAGTSRVTVNVTSGLAITDYAITSPISLTQTANVFSGLLLDTAYQFEVTDANGCVYPANYTTGGFSTIRVRVKSGGDTRVCPSATDGNGAFLIDGFATDYDYTITGPSISLSGTSSNLEIPINNLGEGTYSINVTDNDTNCVNTASLVIEEATTTLSVDADETAMSCQNNNVGRVVAVPTGGFGGYSYELSWPSGTVQGPKNGTVFGNLTEEGTYTLTIIDDEGCEATDTFTLTEVAAPTVTFDSADYCYSSTNAASITVSSIAGSAAIVGYRIGTSGSTQTSPIFTGLVPGTYSIQVVDANGCTGETIAIRIPPQIQVNLNVVNEIPCGGDGEMEISISGGDITDLSSTLYEIVYDNGTLPSTPTVVESGTLPSNPYNYTVPFGSHGTYTVNFIDNNSCQISSQPLTFIAPNNISATHRIVNTSCGDPNSGFVEIIPTLTSGIPPFEVVFAPAPTAGVLVANPNNPNAGATTFAFSSQTIYSGLAIGFYEYVVKDSRNCVSGVTRIEVEADAALPPDASITPIDGSCSLNNLSGGVIINPMISAGIPNYTVIVEDNFGNLFYSQNNVTPSDLPLSITDPSLIPGNYQVIIIDSRGCNDIETLTIGTTNLDIIPTYPPPPVTCTPGGVTVCVEIVNGTGPYEIRLIDPDPLVGWESPNNSLTNHCFAGLLSGVSYTVEVRDLTTGCEYSEVITPPPGINISVSLTVDGVTCRNGDVGINYNITSGTAPYNVIITNLDTGVITYNVIGSNLTTLATELTVPAARYGISVEDTNNCTDGAEIEAIPNLPRVDVIDNQNANCNALGQLTVRATGGTGPYEYAFIVQGTLPPGAIPPLTSFSSSPTAQLPGSSAPGVIYDIWVLDASSCPASTSSVVIQLDQNLPAPTFSVDNQCDAITPLGGFTITVEIPGNIDTPSFTLNGDTQTPIYVPGTPTQAVFNVDNIGIYRVDVIDANGCTSFAQPEVFQTLTASGSFTTAPTCANPDGIITITTNGGTGNFTYLLTGTNSSGPVSITDPDSDGIFPNIEPGTYEVLVTDNTVINGIAACDFTVSGIVSTSPTPPVIQSIGQSNMSCNGVVDGSISVLLQSGTDIDGIIQYNLYTSNLASYAGTAPIATNNSGSFDSLEANTYVVEVITHRGCTDVEEFAIVNPPAFTIAAVAGLFTCETGANRFSTTEITATVNDPGNGGPYGFKLDPADSYQYTNTTSQIFEIVDTGVQQSFLVYAIDDNGCEFVIPSPVVVNPPSTVSGNISTVSEMNCEDPERITVTVVGTTNFTIEDQGSSVALVPDVIEANGASVTFDLPFVAGEYRLQINDAAGCTYLIDPYIVNTPILPNVLINEAKPVSCFGATDGALRINVTDFSGIYDYTIYNANDPGFTGGTFGTPVAGNSTGTIDMLVNGNPFVITGLPAGSHRAVIREQGKTSIACDVYSTVATIRSPNGPLTIDSIEIGRVGCGNNLGEISITAEGGWDSSPYQFLLEIETPLDSGNYTIHTPLGPSDNYTNLASGRYRATVEDIEGCLVSQIMLLEPVPLINAEAIIIRELECPEGNDAIIEAVVPGTTTPGAIGGVPNAGYQYRLLSLNSNDNLDVATSGSTGLQNTPRFVGATGTGVIEAGWYAIEVVSGDCIYRTPSIQVIRPLPINPELILTAVPGCGGVAMMKIELGASAEVGFIYEYRNYLSSDPWLPMTYQNGTAEEFIPGVVGVSYRYEVRKVGATSCEPIPTRGINIEDADPLDLDLASPTFDISCAFEKDGRIEAQIKGGTGVYEFRIYDTNPGTDAFAAIPLATYDDRAVQNVGTFEDLEEGSYWLSVISGSNCSEVEGPFVISAPDPVIIVDSSTPVSCNGGTNGTITMTVTSPSAGLVKFAIEPNLSELISDPDNSESYTFTDLAAGTYTILSQDAEGCAQIFEVEVVEPDQLIISDIQTTPELCIGANDGTAIFTIQGGTPFNDPLISATPYYEYKIEMTSPIDETGTGVFIPYDNSIIENLQGGATYNISIQDVNLCATDYSFSVGIGVNLTAEPLVEYGCEGIFPNSTSSVMVNDENLLPDLLFYLEDINSTDPVLTEQEMINKADVVYTWGDLPASQYRVHIFHQNGCSITTEFEVDGYNSLSLEAIKTGPNELTASAEGGFGGYEFFFQGQSTGTETVFTTNQSTVVNVRVIDQNGCEAVISVPFEFTGMLELPNFFTPDGDNLNDVWAPKNREFFPDIDVKIYDRYGRVVAELNQVTSWDGTYDGNDLPTGDYWYVVNANENGKKRYVGHFTLYR